MLVCAHRCVWVLITLCVYLHEHVWVIITHLDSGRQSGVTGGVFKQVGVTDG